MYFQINHTFRSSGAAILLGYFGSINIWSLRDGKQNELFVAKTFETGHWIAGELYVELYRSD